MKKAFAQVEQINYGHTGSLKIGEVSQASGIGIEALRFYERSGLLGIPARTASGYRAYDAGVLDRLTFIRKAQTLPRLNVAGYWNIVKVEGELNRQKSAVSSNQDQKNTEK